MTATVQLNLRAKMPRARLAVMRASVPAISAATILCPWWNPEPMIDRIAAWVVAGARFDVVPDNKGA